MSQSCKKSIPRSPSIIMSAVNRWSTGCQRLGVTWKSPDCGPSASACKPNMAALCSATSTVPPFPELSSIHIGPRRLVTSALTARAVPYFLPLDCCRLLFARVASEMPRSTPERFTTLVSPVSPSALCRTNAARSAPGTVVRLHAPLTKLPYCRSAPNASECVLRGAAGASSVSRPAAPARLSFARCLSCDTGGIMQDKWRVHTMNMSFKQLKIGQLSCD